MTFGQKVRWRVKYVLNSRKKRDFVLLLPPFLKRKVYGHYPLLGAMAKHGNSLTIQSQGDRVMLSAGGFRFLIPADGFCDGDFFDIIYPSLQKDPFVEDCFDGLDLDGPYEFQGASLATGDVVIDAGANAGFFSAIASPKVGPEGKIFAFEPRTEIADDYLAKNLALNHCENVSIEKRALGKEKGEISFFINSFEGATTLPAMSEPGAQEMKVEQTTLDSFVKENGLSNVDYIKADIEGGERGMLVGAEATLKKFKPKLSIRTYHFKDDPEVLAGIVRRFVPEYHIVQTGKTMYGWIKD